MNTRGKIHDFLAVGVGPFNLSLACLTSTIEGLDGIFVDQNPGFDWHPGVMFDDAHLQTPFLSDLVTLADPTHPLSFLNYIKRQGRIYSFYIREDFFLLRREYNRYCQWAAAQLDSIRWNTRVEGIRYDEAGACYEVITRHVHDGAISTYRAARLVLGTGPAPWWPSCCDGGIQQAANVHHSSEYLNQHEMLKTLGALTVVGSGQSAAEIFVDLLQGIERHPYTLNWVTRSPRFVPLEYTKLTLEMTSPEYVRYFHALPGRTRDALIASQTNLYKGINGSLINDIHELLYQKRLIMDERGEDFGQRVRLYTNSELRDVVRVSSALELSLHHAEQCRDYVLNTDGLIVATGYRYTPPAFLAGIASRIRFDAAGRFAVAGNYTIDRAGEEIFVQNAELHTHGFVTPDLGMACYRNSHIIKAMTGVAHYPVEERIAFQEFGVPGDLATASRPLRQVAS
ncbi:MAG: SidA/IucD/PvdA family monooxygenase [Pseudomonadota bacterium]|nr:SidA/IucD/PvdA family monooxygenase [Pseudomonadota bacterium]